MNLERPTHPLSGGPRTHGLATPLQTPHVLELYPFVTLIHQKCSTYTFVVVAHLSEPLCGGLSKFVYTRARWLTRHVGHCRSWAIWDTLSPAISGSTRLGPFWAWDPHTPRNRSVFAHLGWALIGSLARDLGHVGLPRP